MADLTNSGHRERLRRQFINTGLEGFSDHQILELILTYSISRKDVKPQAKALLNRFGSLENVFKADIRDIVKVDGIGERSAVLLKLFYETHIVINSQKNLKTKRLDSSEAAQKFVSNILSPLKVENIIVITLKNNMDIINVHVISKGIANRSDIDTREIIAAICRDNPASIIIAHNHPDGSAVPSAADINFTLSVNALMRTLNVFLIDHIIVGEDGPFSMRNKDEYKNYFD